MKQLKYLLLFILTLSIVAVTVVSCKKNFLDRRPLGRYVESDIPAGSFDNKVFAMYADLRSFSLNGNTFVAIENFRDDLSEKGSSASDGAAIGQMYDHFQYNKSDGSLGGYWNALYKIIIDANAIIHDIDSLNVTDPNTLTNKGEAQFLRAYAYFKLVQNYGEVPLFTVKVTDQAQVNVPKSPVAKIFELIDSDLQGAVATLPLRWNAQYLGRLTQGAALTLQSYTFLWRKNWAGALAACTQIINSKVYSLVPKYEAQFRETGENGPESIFEYQAYFSLTIRNLGLQYAQVQGVRGAGLWNLGWGWNVPTQKLVDAFEPGDTRKAGTILFSGQTDPIYGREVPPVPTVPRPYWNMKIYTDPAKRVALNSQAGEWMNHRIYRYADVLLMAAEAANELGGAENQQNAIDWLEQVRARARGNNSGSLPKVTTTDKDEFRKAIQHERMVELGMEEKRFYDLVRWGLDVEELGPLGYQPKNRLLPLPQSEVDKSGGVLVQNPDYQ